MDSMALEITIGADPEFFLESHDGVIKSAIGLVGGTKRDPRPLGNLPGYFVQEDNVAVEFNIPPATEVQEFMQSIEWAIANVTIDVSKYKLRPRITAAEVFPALELATIQAQLFGCEPDYNAWNNGKRNPRPKANNTQLRTSGGHIHVGVNQVVDPIDMVKAMDLFLGVPSVMMDQDFARRGLYGRSGAFRHTHHSKTAWEYRVLSNFWIKTPALRKWAFEQTIRAVNFVRNLAGETFARYSESYDLDDEIQECIDDSNINLSARLINEHNLVVT